MISPSCYIRSDVTHLIMLICRWKCWKEKRIIRLKKFYVRCIRLLIKFESISELRSILIDILTVCCSEVEGKCYTSKTDCPNVARINLIKQIKRLPSIKNNEYYEELNNFRMKNVMKYLMKKVMTKNTTT